VSTAAEHALIPSISIEGLINARDGALETLRRAARDIEQAREAMRLLNVELPRVAVDVNGDRDGTALDKEHLDDIKQEIDRVAWAALFNQSGVSAIMSSKKRAELSGMLHDRNAGRYHNTTPRPPELTADNIRATFADLYSKRGEMFDESVEEVFKKLSWDHKTNSPQRFQPKMILGYCLQTNYGHAGSCAGVRYDGVLPDLERVLHMLAGKPLPTYQMGLNHTANDGALLYGVKVAIPATDGPSLFALRCYMKGTCHVWVDSYLIDQMNRIMARLYPGVIGRKGA
jgi:hypothetical protein